jgi:glycosyltransferase involved in cell wall biosynthesis
MKKKILVVAGILEKDGRIGYTQPFVDRQIESLQQSGIEIISYSIRGWQTKLNYILSIFRINRLLKKDKSISLIHAHYSYSGIICSFQKRVPVVVSLMGDDIYGTAKENGKIFFLSKINLLLIKLFKKRWAAVIVKSNKMSNYISHPNLFVIPNGIDLGKFSPIEKNKAREILGLKLDGKYILFGGDPNNMRKNFKLARQTADILINEGVKVTLLPLKNLAHSQIPLYLSASDSLLFTSYYEGSPNIVKEALACNLPIVSVKVGDVEERLQGVEGCYLADYDAIELAKYVKLVLQNNSYKNLRAAVLNLSLPETARKIIDIYQKILDNNLDIGFAKNEKTATMIS